MYIFVDKCNKIIGKIENNTIIEIYYYEDCLNNIYRAKVLNKNKALDGYFIEYKSGKNLYLKSKNNYKIGDNVIVEYISPPSNGKLGLASENYKLENESYYLSRFPLDDFPKLKDNRKESQKLYQELIDLRNDLENEINFFPTPKLLLEKSFVKDYLDKNKGLEVREIDITNQAFFNNLISSITKEKLDYMDYSIIINELETLTVIDVNSKKKKSTGNKEIFNQNINLNLIGFIIHNLIIRNIGGMVVIDFLRVKDKKIIVDEFIKEISKTNLKYRIYGFSRMGLFEFTIKRHGDTSKKELQKRGII